MIKIRVTCTSTDLIEPDKLIPFQGDLKILETKQFRKLATSIIEHGFAFPEYAWRKNGKAFTLDGHQRTRVMIELLKKGWTDNAGQHHQVELVGKKVPVVWVKAKDEKSAKRLVLAAMSQYGKYTEESIYEFVHTSELDWKDVKTFVDFPAIHMGKLEVGWFGDNLIPEKADDVPDVPKKAITKKGDLWELGNHRLYCGDARDPISYGHTEADLLVTDPPYGVDYAEKNKYLRSIGRSNQKGVFDGDEDVETSSALWREAFRQAHIAMKKGACFYVTGPPGPLGLDMLIAVREAGLTPKQVLVWLKHQQVFGRSDYHYKHEFIFYGWKEGKGHSYFGRVGEPSVWEVERPKASAEHPTMKPVKLFARAIRNGTTEGGLVLDNFCGAGTTLIAAEELERRAYGIEIERVYCDVTVERWETYTGKKAKRKKS